MAAPGKLPSANEGEDPPEEKGDATPEPAVWPSRGVDMVDVLSPDALIASCETNNL